MTTPIKYRRGYKYQLAEDYPYKLDFNVPQNETQDFIKLKANNQLVIKKGYAWDGPSGGVPDSKRNLRASLIHDALYQLLRNQVLDMKLHRDPADKLFKKLCKEDGVSDAIAHGYYLALKKFGKKAASHKNKKQILHAP